MSKYHIIVGALIASAFTFVPTTAQAEVTTNNTPKTPVITMKGANKANTAYNVAVTMPVDAGTAVTVRAYGCFTDENFDAVLGYSSRGGELTVDYPVRYETFTDTLVLKVTEDGAGEVNDYVHIVSPTSIETMRETAPDDLTCANALLPTVKQWSKKQRVKGKNKFRVTPTRVIARANVKYQWLVGKKIVKAGGKAPRTFKAPRKGAVRAKVVVRKGNMRQVRTLRFR